MKDSDLDRIRAFIRPSFRGLAVSVGFCLILGFIVLIVTAGKSPSTALAMMAASAAVLAIPVFSEWRPYFLALSEMRGLREDPAMRQAIVKDYDTSQAAFQGELRIGSIYLFGKGSGALLRRAERCTVVFGKRSYKGGWNWRIALKVEGDVPQMLLDLNREDWSEEAIKACVAHANALLAE